MSVSISQDATMNKTTEKLIRDAGIDMDYLINTKQIILIEELVKSVAEQCALLCGAQADKKIIRLAFGIPTEGDVKYPAPEQQGHRSQYEREYNLP
jgi:hypothetical protein